MTMLVLFLINRLNWILIMLAHLHSSPQKDRPLHSERL